MSYRARLRAWRSCQVKELPGYVQQCICPAATGIFPTGKWDVLCLIKYSKTMKEKASLAVGNYSVQLDTAERETLNVSKFRISSDTTPEIINSGLRSQPLPLICGTFVLHFLPRWLRKPTLPCCGVMGSIGRTWQWGLHFSYQTFLR